MMNMYIQTLISNLPVSLDRFLYRLVLIEECCLYFQPAQCDCLLKPLNFDGSSGLFELLKSETRTIKKDQGLVLCTCH